LEHLCRDHTLHAFDLNDVVVNATVGEVLSVEKDSQYVDRAPASFDCTDETINRIRKHLLGFTVFHIPLIHILPPLRAHPHFIHFASFTESPVEKLAFMVISKYEQEDLTCPACNTEGFLGKETSTTPRKTFKIYFTVAGLLKAHPV
jgi:hypothetical protein